MKIIPSIIRRMAAAALLLPAIAVSGRTIEFTYNLNDSPSYGYGFGKAGSYEVCVYVGDASLVGAKVTGISVPLPDNGNGEVEPTFKAWVITERPGTDEALTPDLAYGEGTVSDNVLSLTFAEPATIPAGGVFVGYTVTVTNIEGMSQSYPVATVSGTADGGLYVRSPEVRPKWQNLAVRSERVSPMIVSIEGDFADNEAAPVLNVEPYVEAGGEYKLSAAVANHGLEPIESIDYTYTYDDGTEGSGAYTLSEAVPARFGATCEVELDMKSPVREGDRELTLRIDKVNGKANRDPGGAATLTVHSLPFVPVNRPLVEEYTGLWCGACPSGYVALEQGNYYYGRDFVAIAFHYDDPMQTYHRFPQTVNHYPTVNINRSINAGPSGLLREWNIERQNLAPVDIAVDIKWADAAHTRITATATARFLDRSSSRDYRFAYALVADGLKNSSWSQANYFAGESYTGPFWELFTKGGAYVRNLEFNDVMLLFDDCFGVEKSLPTVIEAGNSYSHDYTFNLSDVRNGDGQKVIQDIGKLRVVAMVVDADENIVLNCISSGYSAEAGYSSAEALPSEVVTVSTRWYDFQGNELKEPVAGQPCIRVDRLSDGTTRASKQLEVR